MVNPMHMNALLGAVLAQFQALLDPAAESWVSLGSRPAQERWSGLPHEVRILLLGVQELSCILFVCLYS